MQHSRQFPQPSQIAPPPGVNPDQAAISLMAMAETFRSAGRYKLAIKCCQTALRVPATNEIFAFCSFELGKLLWHYTHNQELAQFHLAHSLRLMRQLGTSLEQERLKTAALLAEVMLARRLFADCIEVLKGELTDSPKFPPHHNKLLLLYAEAQLRLGEFGRALEAVQAGVQFSRSAGAGGVLMECYFRLVKSLILSIQMTDQQELGKSVGELGEILQSVTVNEQDQAAINDIRAFCYAIQLCYFLATGMIKSSKQCLRQLHITVQATEAAAKNGQTVLPSTSSSPIRWLTHEMLTGFAYVLTVLCNIHYANFERAHRYHGTAMKHLEGMRTLMRTTWPVVENRTEEFIGRMEMLLHEGLAQLHLVRGSPGESLASIVEMCQSIRQSRQPAKMLHDFGPQLHTLLGLYAVNMRDLGAAERQFRAAVKGTSEPELWTLGNLSLALVHLSTGKEADFYDLFDAISPAKIRAQASSIRSAAFLVQGLHYFIHSRQQECKKQLLDSIAISKEEDMARLQSMALLLLAKLLRSKDALKAAYEWAGKSNDAWLLLWANSEVLSLGGSSSEEMAKIAEEIRDQRERLESSRASSSRMDAHKLTQWIDGEVPDENLYN